MEYLKLYSHGSLSEYLSNYFNTIIKEINNNTDSYLLNVNVDDYAEFLKDKYTLDIPEIHIDQIHTDQYLKEIPSNLFPGYDLRYPGPIKKYTKQVIKFIIPYSGNIGLLCYEPDNRYLETYKVLLDNNYSSFIIEIINFSNDRDKIIKDFEIEKGYFLSNFHGIKDYCFKFNLSLKSRIITSINNKKNEITKNTNFLLSLNLPIKTKDEVSKTFSIPSPKLRPKIVLKPTVNGEIYLPEPSLEFDIYYKILNLIFDIGQNLERYPRNYIGKGEEAIRDSILFVLDPNFENASATGETFNKSGKTDICIRHESNVVFIAECKIWKGAKNFLETIDQILGYLTWRESKVAVINFVKSQNITDVLVKIKSSIINHSNFLELVNDSDSSWSNYKFHLNGDRNRIIHLAVISFHLPEKINNKISKV